MEALRAIASGKPTGPDAVRAALRASELLHGARTGRHPRGGGLSRQRLSYARRWPAALLTVPMIDGAQRRAPEGSGGRPA